LDNQLQSPQTTSLSDTEAIAHLKAALASGKHWYLALLEAIGLWTTSEEMHNRRHYRYLICDEAFDWLVLAERLCAAVDGLLPQEEKEALLFYNEPPLKLSPEEFEKIIGHSKYCQYLNYLYGIIVEQALIQAVQEEVRKERQSSGYTKESERTNEVYLRIYDETQTNLLKEFRQERGYAQIPAISLMEIKEFTYWLFKYRIKHCDKARVASDTKKGLDQLKRQQKRKRIRLDYRLS
jgi:hypothetical protein